MSTAMNSTDNPTDSTNIGNQIENVPSNDNNNANVMVTNNQQNNTENVTNSANTMNTMNTINTNNTTIVNADTSQPQQTDNVNNNNNNNNNVNINNRKRARDEMLNESNINTSNTNTNTNTNTPSNEEVVLNVCVAKNNNKNTNDISNIPTKKMKLSDNNNNNSGVNATIPNANSDAFDENPYLPLNNNNTLNTSSASNGYYSPEKAKVLSRNQSDLKRYLSTMDEDVLRNDLLPKLCQKHQHLMQSIKTKMSQNTILCKIFIRSLSYDTQDKTVYDIFNKFGNVKEAVIVKDRQTGKSRGFGFITMSNASEAQAALVEHRKMIDGREAICNLASKPQGQKTSTSKPKRDDSFRSSHNRSDHSSHGRKRENLSPPNMDRRYAHNNRNNTANTNAAAAAATMMPPPPPPNYGYPATTVNPYYDYNYQHSSMNSVAPHTANTTAINPYNSIPYNPYAQYNTNANVNNTNNAATQNNANAANANTNIANQPYVPAMAGQNVTANMAAFGAAPYRFN